MNNWRLRSARGGIAVHLSGIAGLLGIAACANSAPKARECTSTQGEALFNAGTHTTFLGLSTEQQAAIGRVWPDGAPRGFFCSGVLIAPDWVLTAAHCSFGAGFEFEPGVGTEGGPSHRSSRQVLLHPQYDLIAFRLEASVPAATLPVLAETLEERRVGTPVLLAGYGTTEDGTPSRELRFLSELVAKVTDDAIVVEGGGRVGACSGDSGGPLLLRNASGHVAVAGVLAARTPGRRRQLERFGQRQLSLRWTKSPGQDHPLALPRRRSGRANVPLGDRFCAQLRRRQSSTGCHGG